MTAQEVYEHLLSRAAQRWEKTCDGLIAGDPAKPVRKAGVCFKLTAQLLAQAAAAGIDVIITHEPTFSHGDNRADAAPIDIRKWAMLDESGITLYRFHDHAHNTLPDTIHAGFLRDLGLNPVKAYPRESLGVCRYELAQPATPRAIAQLIEQTLGIEFVRIAGDPDFPVQTICLGLGSVGFDQLNVLLDPGCDLFITGECGEVCTCEYFRDACYFGEHKAILLLGHYSAEFSGMRLLAEQLNDLLPTEYLDSGEVYHRA